MFSPHILIAILNMFGGYMMNKKKPISLHGSKAVKIYSTSSSSSGKKTGGCGCGNKKK
jgi:hypothetical protein